MLLSAATGQAESRALLVGALVALVALALAPTARLASPLAIPVIVVASRRYARFRDQAQLHSRLKSFYERGSARLKGDWPGQGQTGEEYSQDGHPYERDLSILGSGSLFELLCTARTESGRARLAAFLLNPSDPELAISRQGAVRELTEHKKLREELATFGSQHGGEENWQGLTEWLDTPRAYFPRILPGVLAATAASLATLAFAALIRLLPWSAALPWIAGIGTFHGITGFVLQRRVRASLACGRKLAGEVSVLASGLALLAEQRFESPLLAGLVEHSAQAPAAVRKLGWWMHWVRERDREWLYWFSIYMMLGTQLAAAMERWRVRYTSDLRAWLDAWAEFEALNSLACYAHEHPEDAYPEFSEVVEFDAADLGHPLLSAEGCVRNDVRLNDTTRFLVISGSNMAGKSTLLRSMGTNAVLALAGAPVRANRMRLAPFRVCASIGAPDSLLEGKSRFMAEVERIRDTLAAVSTGGPVLFVIDEIFSGTNSQDRRIAAEAVIRALMKGRAVGAISTHDLALTEIAALPDLHGENVHMASRDESSPLDFDYRLQPGVNRQSNALAIARLAGVEV